jgi:excisionase family DNA binding protein
MGLTTSQAAAILGVIPRRVQALIRAGKIKAAKHGRDWLADAESVEAYRLTRKNGAPRKER